MRLNPLRRAKSISAANQVECECGPPETLTHRKALKLYKVAKKSRAKTPGGFSPNEADEMRRTMIIAVKLFGERIIQFRHIDGRADGIDHQKIVKATDDPHFSPSVAAGPSPHRPDRSGFTHPRPLLPRGRHKAAMEMPYYYGYCSATVA